MENCKKDRPGRRKVIVPDINMPVSMIIRFNRRRL